jgi:hypothetical protein
LDLQTLGSQLIMPKNLPDHWYEHRILTCVYYTYIVAPWFTISANCTSWVYMMARRLSSSSKHYTGYCIYRHIVFYITSSNFSDDTSHKSVLQRLPWFLTLLLIHPKLTYWNKVWYDLHLNIPMLARCVLEPILKAGWNFWDSLFPPLKLWQREF